MKHLRGFKFFEAQAQGKAQAQDDKKSDKKPSGKLADKSVVDRLKKDLLADKNDLVADLKEEGLLEGRRYQINESLAITSILGLVAVAASALGWMKFDDYKIKLKIAKLVAEEAKKSGKSVAELKKDDNFMKSVEVKARRKGLLGPDFAGGGTGSKIKESVDVEISVEDLAKDLGIDVEELESEIEEVKDEMESVKEGRRSVRGRMLREFDETFFITYMAPSIVAAAGMLGFGYLFEFNKKLELARLVWKEAGSVKNISKVLKDKAKMKELTDKVGGTDDRRYKHSVMD
jgi:hypothetical protein